MKPRITVVTLAVEDLEGSLAFYRDGLGLPTKGIVGREFEHGAVAFFDLQAGVTLAIFSREDLAYDTGLSSSTPNALEFSIGHTVRSELEVDQVMQQAKRAGRA
jgi:catechol 2,3-dioxygenase-like lactoylglutathione lyase family enzyme